MARKASIEIQNTDNQGNKTEVSKSIPVEKAASYVKSSAPKGARSVFAKGRGARPRAIARPGRGPRSCFAVGSKGGPRDGSGPLGGTAACDLNQG